MAFAVPNFAVSKVQSFSKNGLVSQYQAFYSFRASLSEISVLASAANI